MKAADFKKQLEKLKQAAELRCAGHPDLCPCADCLLTEHLYDAAFAAEQLSDEPAEFVVLAPDGFPAARGLAPAQAIESAANYNQNFVHGFHRTGERYRAAAVDAKCEPLVAKRRR